MIHALGFSSQLFQNFLNRETGQRWGSSFPLTKYINPKYPHKEFTILQTPMAHKYASKRFGKKEFAPGIKMGIELEDGGSSGTKGHHPEKRVYHSEVFSGQIDHFPQYLSDLSLCLIEDMGWYSVNFSLAEELPYGNKELMENEKFPTDPPLSVFPKHYLGNSETIFGCTYDYKSIGLNIPSQFTCPDNIGYCSNLAFYNSEYLPFRGFDELSDYVPLYFSLSDLRCNSQTDEKYKYVTYLLINFMNFSKESYCWNTKHKLSESLSPGCYFTRCSSHNDFVEFYIDEKIYRCNYENEKININHTLIEYFECPNPLTFCKTINLKNKKIENFERVPFPLDYKPPHPTESPPSIFSTYKQNNEKNINKYYYYVVGISLIFIIILIIIFFSLKTKNDESTTFQEII